MFLLEKRILFDGSGAVDLGDCNQDDSNHDSNEHQDCEQSNLEEGNSQVVVNADTKNIDILVDDVFGVDSGVEKPANGIKVLLLANNVTNGYELNLADDVLTISFDPEKTKVADIERGLKSISEHNPIESTVVIAKATNNGYLQVLKSDSDRAFWQTLGVHSQPDSHISLISSEVNSNTISSIENLSGKTTDYFEYNNCHSVHSNSGLDIDESNSLANELESCFSDESFHDLDLRPTATVEGKELVVISHTVLDVEKITANFSKRAEILHLTGEGDLSTTLQEYLRTHTQDGSQYSAIHIVSHGNKAGYLVINDEHIDLNYVANHSQTLEQLHDYLTPDADLMLYGCDVATGPAGKDLVQKLSSVMGVSVAANATDSRINDNWNLEYVCGILQKNFLNGHDYDHHLANIKVTNTQDQGDGSLRSAIEHALSGNEITFELDKDANKALEITKTLEISKTLSISGKVADKNINISANGEHSFSLFKITSPQKQNPITVKLNNLEITGKKSENKPPSGAGIYIKKVSVSLSYVDFKNCGSTICGGAITAVNSALTINSAFFMQNHAKSGGAIYSDNNRSLIINSTKFVKNNSNTFGGAICSNNSTIEIKDQTSFEKNKAHIGGAIADSKSIIKIKGETKFEENKSISYGGAIATDNSEICIKGKTNFEKNKSNSCGGAICSNNSTIEIKDQTSFVNNASTQHGSAIYSKSSTIDIKGNTNFENNKATHSGGAIYSYKSTIDIKGNTRFENNRTKRYGGAIYSYKSTVKINGDTSLGLGNFEMSCTQSNATLNKIEAKVFKLDCSDSSKVTVSGTADAIIKKIDSTSQADLSNLTINFNNNLKSSQEAGAYTNMLIFTES